MTDLWWPSLVASTLVWAVMTCKWANVSLSIARDAKRLVESARLSFDATAFNCKSSVQSSS